MFRKYINLIESHIDELLTHTISDCVANGEHEGFKPYWKLLADERVLSDHDAMTHIAGLISDGYRSGAHPHWELKVVEPEENLEDQMEGELELQEETIDVVHAHMVVPVAETHGEGQGWYEVSDAEATMWVVEDEHGSPIESFDTRAAADAHSNSMNAEMAPTDMKTYAPEKELVEDDEEDAANGIFYCTGCGREEMDCSKDPCQAVLDDRGELELEEEDEVMDGPTRFDGSQNFVVIINAIHERGEKQQEALAELNKRGLWLSDEQKVQAGLA